MDQIPLIPDHLPPGFRCFAEFVSPDEERGLLDSLKSLPWMPYQYGPYTAHRKVVGPGEIPDFAEPLRKRAAHAMGIDPAKLDSVLFTHYAPGVGIGWHHDAPLYDEVFGISLLGRCTMQFRLKRGNTYVRTEAVLDSRSAYAMTGPSRKHWQHRIERVESERYSITFRTSAQRINLN